MRLLEACRWMLLLVAVGAPLPARAQVPVLEPPIILDLLRPADISSDPDLAADADEPIVPDSSPTRFMSALSTSNASTTGLGAIEVYQEALEQWPGRVEFRHRLRLCETHYKLVRRYQDRSFREVLLPLSRDQALALYDEVLERIELHYVETCRHRSPPPPRLR